MFWRRGLAALLVLGFSSPTAWSSSGTEGASFLDIPVGAEPAALGSAYTARANDVYAPVWNPAGLGFLHDVEFAGMHLNYLSPFYYENAGFVIPLEKDKEDAAATAPGGLGGSIQYLGSGSLDARDDQGNPQGSFSASFAAYSLAYGHKVSDTLSLGVTGKVITEKIAGASASAYATDLGLLYRPVPKLNLGAAVSNIGSEIKFVNESDPLPLNGRLSAGYQLLPQWDISAESVYRKTGLASGSVGVEWRCGEMFSFRGGYNTAHIKELGGASGVTAGAGLFFWGQEFSYAWVPIGDLGQTHYFSLVFRLSTQARPERPRLKSARDSDRDFGDLNSEDPSRYHDIFDILNDDERKSAQ